MDGGGKTTWPGISGATRESYTGRYWIENSTSPAWWLTCGPYFEPFAQPMRMRSASSSLPRRQTAS
jgi:hypothetical protein